MQQRIARWYKTVDVGQAAGAASKWLVRLDGRPILTPLRAPLALPTAALALASATEWDRQPKMVTPSSMPINKLATTATDQISQIRPQLTSSMLRCLDSDLACIRSEEPELAVKASGNSL